MDGKDTAYPIAFDTQNGLHVFSGLTKRELFAAMAMQGILSAGNGWPDRTLYKEIAHRAVIQANALLDALNADESK